MDIRHGPPWYTRVSSQERLPLRERERHRPAVWNAISLDLGTQRSRDLERPGPGAWNAVHHSEDLSGIPRADPERLHYFYITFSLH